MLTASQKGNTIKAYVKETYKFFKRETERKMLKVTKHNNFRSSAKQAGFMPTYWSVSEISNARQLPTDSPGVLLM